MYTFTTRQTRGKGFFFSNERTRRKSSGGEFSCERDNHLGNVLAVISDKVNLYGHGLIVNNKLVLDSARATVVSASDYYPGGLVMKGREFSSSTYRYGFNGKENDKEFGWQDYGARMYMQRIGRFPSPDPLIIYGQKYPELSSYQFASNRPIDGVDLDGLEYSTSGKYFSYPENKYRVDNTAKITIANSSKIVNDKETVNTYSQAIMKTISADQSGGSGTYNDPIVTTNVVNTTKATIKINLTDATRDEKGRYTSGYTHGGIGNTQINSTDVAISVDGIPRGVSEVERTASHEQGHVTGLKHPFHGAKETDIGGRGPNGATYKSNLMNSYGGSDKPNRSDYNPIPSTQGHVVTPQQRGTITTEIEKDTNKPQTNRPW